MSGTNRERWLLIGGPLSGYTFDLFRAVRALAGIDVAIVHDPIAAHGAFGHQRFEDPDFESIEWRTASSVTLARFISRPQPSAVFVYGLEARRALAFARALVPRDVPFFYAADTNITALVEREGLLGPRLVGYRMLAPRIDVALSLGLTNELALRLLGMRRIEPIPIYSVDYEALDRSALSAPPSGLEGPARGRLDVAVIARFVAAKNLVSTLDAVGQDSTLCARLRLLLAGDGPLRPQIEAVVARYPGLHARLLGAVPHSQVGALITRVDALLLPSVREPWGIVVTEALGMGVPVVATPAVGAAVSLAGSTQAVVLSESKSADSVAGALRQFVERHAALTTAARAAAAQVRERYGQVSVARALVRLVHEVRAGAPVRSTAVNSPRGVSERTRSWP